LSRRETPSNYKGAFPSLGSAFFLIICLELFKPDSEESQLLPGFCVAHLGSRGIRTKSPVVVRANPYFDVGCVRLAFTFLKNGMNSMSEKNKCGWFTLAGILTMAISELAIAQHGGGHAGSALSAGSRAYGAHQHLDSRFSHNQYYYDHGYSVRTPPAGGVGELHGRDGGRYYCTPHLSAI